MARRLPGCTRRALVRRALIRGVVLAAAREFSVTLRLLAGETGQSLGGVVLLGGAAMPEDRAAASARSSAGASSGPTPQVGGGTTISVRGVTVRSRLRHSSAPIASRRRPVADPVAGSAMLGSR